MNDTIEAMKRVRERIGATGRPVEVAARPVPAPALPARLDPGVALAPIFEDDPPAAPVELLLEARTFFHSDGGELTWLGFLPAAVLRVSIPARRVDAGGWRDAPIEFARSSPDATVVEIPYDSIRRIDRRLGHSIRVEAGGRSVEFQFGSEEDWVVAFDLLAEFLPGHTKRVRRAGFADLAVRPIARTLLVLVLGAIVFGMTRTAEIEGPIRLEGRHAIGRHAGKKQALAELSNFLAGSIGSRGVLLVAAAILAAILVHGALRLRSRPLLLSLEPAPRPSGGGPPVG